MNHKKISIIIFVLIFLVLGFLLFFLYKSNKNIYLSDKESKNLSILVLDALNKKITNGYQRQIDDIKINEVYYSGNAVKGNWILKDYWDWIAWRPVGGEWKILISLDAFDCDELDNIPKQYDYFFNDVVYNPPGHRYCEYKK